MYTLIWSFGGFLISVALKQYSGENLQFYTYTNSAWSRVPTKGLPEGPMHIATLDSIIFGSTGSGIYYLGAGDSAWDSLPKPKAPWDTNTGLNIASSICFFQGNLYVGYFGSGVFTYESGKGKPHAVGNLTSETVDILKVNTDYLYCGLHPNGILRLRKNASDWQDFTPLHDWCCGVNDFAFVGDTLYAAFGSGRILSLDLKRLPP